MGQDTVGVGFIRTSVGSLRKMMLVCARHTVAQCLETYSIKVLDSMRLSGGRKDDLSVFALPPGLTASVMRSSLVLIRPKIKLLLLLMLERVAHAMTPVRY